MRESEATEDHIKQYVVGFMSVEMVDWWRKNV